MVQIREVDSHKTAFAQEGRGAPVYATLLRQQL